MVVYLTQVYCDFTVTVNTQEKRFVDATIKISTDVPGEETLTVPVTALIE